MTENRKFHLGDILSITAGPLVSPTGINGVYAILGYMTDDKLFSHQLSRAVKECAPNIISQHPQLEEVDPTDCTPENYKEWLNKQIAKYGEYLPIKPLVSGIHEYKDAIEELEEKIGPDKVILVNLSTDENIDPALN
ncbi:MAG: hypothetical protein KBB91_01505 [Candidatus Pacebacteria bacterium]|jgi:hypothetical protein|nr:hypothetical protein [Candidatus Paceibacterota bacterium]MBP9700915.1 hypothetical protein [Candidatus Paceibacterota bacterium]